MNNFSNARPVEPPLRPRASPGNLLQHRFPRYALAVVSVAFADAARLALAAWLGPGIPPFLIFYPILMAVALLAGFGPGALATVLAAAGIAYGILPTESAWAASSPTDQVSLAIFIGNGLFMCAVAEFFRRSRSKAVAYDREMQFRIAKGRIRESDERFRKIFEYVGTGVVMCHLDGRFQDANPAFCKLLGYSADELKTLKFEALIHPEDLETNLAGIRRMMENHLPHFEIENRCRRKDGSSVWVRKLGSVLRDETGRATHLIVLVTDETARMEAASALRESEHFLQRVTEVTPGILQVYDLEEKRNVFINRSVASVLGYSPDEVQAMGAPVVPALMHPDDLPRFEEHLGRVRGLADGEVLEFEHRMRHRTGDWLWFRNRDAIFARHGDGAVRQIIGAALDITERRRAETALNRNASLFATIIEQAPGGVYVVDADFRLQAVNAEALPVFKKVRPLIGRDFNEVMEIIWGPEIGGQRATTFRETLATGKRYISPRFSALRQELGPERAYEWETQRITLPDGQHGVVCYFTDVTDRHRAELTLQQAKEAAEAANRSKDRFLATLSHELRTPLTPVLMTAAVLRLDERLPAEIREEIEMIEHNVALEARLIDDLLDLTKIANGKLSLRPEPCDMHTLVNAVAQMLAGDIQTKQIDLKLELAAPRHRLSADPDRLQQVIWNLLRNALKFTATGGHVRVRSFNPPAGPAEGDEFRLAIEVTDDGIGFEPGIGDSLFEPFEQGASGHPFGGLGLGLAIARGIVVMHQGSIRSESAGPGKGATFTFELPGRLPRLSQVSDSLRDGRRDRGELPERDIPMRLLVVEDHEPTIKAMTQLLTRAGHEVVAARSVSAARAAAQRQVFDLVISDLGLPDGNGIDLMQHLRDAHGLRGIALTGYGHDSDVHASASAGFAEYLVKPVKIADLRRAMRRLTM